MPRCTYKKIYHNEIQDLRTTQVSIIFSQCSYLHIVFISVSFTMVGAFRIVAKCACVFVVFCFVCFRSRSYPVPHRGERVKQGTVHPRNTAIIKSQKFLVS